MKPHLCDTFSAPFQVAMHKNSHIISKLKPKIRIIHVFAPEIIKTDVENFRELVQKLTGKPAGHGGAMKSSSTTPIKALRTTICARPEPSKVLMDKQDDIKKEETEIWELDENSKDFLGGFGDMDGLIQDLTEFPLLPFNFLLT